MDKRINKLIKFFSTVGVIVSGVLILLRYIKTNKTLPIDQPDENIYEE